MTAYASNQDGNWSNSAVWMPTGVPTDGDTVTIGHDITADAPSTITVGDDSSTPAIQFANTYPTTATLTIASGVTLKLKGDLGKASTSTTAQALIVVSAGATLCFYPASTKTLQFNVGCYIHRLVCNGTSGNHATVTTDLGRSGHNTIIVVQSGATCGLKTATYTDFSHLGNTASYGMFSNFYGTTDGDITVTNCTFNDADLGVTMLNSTGSTNITITDNWFTNFNYYNGSSNRYALFLSISVTADSGTRSVLRNRFMGYGYLGCSAVDGVNVDYNYMDDVFFGDDNEQWLSFDGNFCYHQAVSENTICGGISNNYLLFGTSGAGSNSFFLGNSAATQAYVGNICQSLATFEAPGFLGLPEGGADPARVATFAQNIALPNAAGGASGAILIIDTNGTDSNPPQYTFLHNTAIVGPTGGSGAGGAIGATCVVGPQTADTLLACKGNLLWRTGSRDGYVLQNNWGTPVTDLVSGANADYNATASMKQVPGGTWSDAADGTQYNTPLSASPGTHDHDFGVISSGESDGPQFVDISRNLQTWGQLVHSTDGSVGAALTLLQNDPTLTKNDLIPWVRAGFRPRASALVHYYDSTHAYPGDTYSTDASGNPMVGTVGAMAYSSMATTYTITPPSPAKGDLTVASQNFTLAADGPSSANVTLQDDAYGDPDAGTFSPNPVTLNGTTPVPVTYTPLRWGTRSITGTNDGGLSDPSAVDYLAMVQLGISGTNSTDGSGPAGGNIAPAFGGFAFDVGPYWAEIGRDVTGDEVDYQSDGLFANWLARMTVVKVALISNVATLTVTMIPDPGSYQIGTVVEVSGLANSTFDGTWTLTAVSGQTVSFALTHANISATADHGYVCLHVPLHVDFVSTASGTTAYGLYGMPFNVVAGNQSTQGITYTEGGHDAGSTVPVPIPVSIEGVVPGDNRPTSDPAGDRHLVLFVRDETTGGIDHLIELYQPVWDGVSAWVSEGGAKFDVAGGVQRIDNGTLIGADAAALPIGVLTTKYEEVERVILGLDAGPGLKHPIRITIANGFFDSYQQWPAISTINYGYAPNKIPCGGRLRLREDWYDANKDSFPLGGQARVILDTMRYKGCIVADASSGLNIFIEGNTDDRWDPDSTGMGIYSLVNVPVSAMQMLRIQPQFSLDGPACSLAGTNPVVTVAKAGTEVNYGAGIYVRSGSDVLGDLPITDATPSGTATAPTPDAGQYRITANVSGPGWYTPTGPTVNPPTTLGDHALVITAIASTTDLFDAFPGAAGDLASHTSGSGATWSGSGVLSLNGSGAVYTSGTFTEGTMPVSSWTPPGTDYAVWFVVGADFATGVGTGSNPVGVSLRVQGSSGSQSYYFAQVYYTGSQFKLQVYRWDGSAYHQVGTTQTLSSVVAGDTFMVTVAGAGSTVTLTVSQNGMNVFSGTDTASGRITTAGIVALRINVDHGGHDIMRTVWAGAIGGPTAGGITA